LGVFRSIVASSYPIQQRGPAMLRSALLAATLALAPATAALADEDTGRIAITGTASINATPDLATVYAGVESTGPTARDALTANSTLMNSVFAAIEKLGIEERDVGTSNFSISQNWRHGQDGSKPDGYRVSNQVTLRLRDVSRIGEALDALTSAGVNQAGNIRFEVENSDALLDDARREAVGKARTRAELYAAAAGVKLGKVMSINEGGFAPGPQPQFYAAEARAMSAPPIAPGEQKLEVSVTVTWALKE